jgi:hypothetical protein
MVVLKMLDRTLMDREALAQWLQRPVSTIRNHCQPCGMDRDGRTLYHAEQCQETLSKIQTRRRVA